MRYDVVFLDVDKTILWVDVDIEGYVEDLAPYTKNGSLTVEQAEGAVWEGMRKHIYENINYQTEEELAEFRRNNARDTARNLGLDVPGEVLDQVQERRILYNPYPASEAVMQELRAMGLPLYAVSNWDIQLAKVLEDLGWTRYFEGIVASAEVGSEKPDGHIFEEALRVAGFTGRRDRVVHVGNDPVSDIRGAASSGIDAVLIDREGCLKAPEALVTLPDLRGLPALVRGREDG